ncbi:hypothetical protein PS1_005710 [Malus domestica]
MGIYGQRVQVRGSVIIDGGSGYCKFSCSKYACPSGRSVTFLEFGMLSRRCTRDSTIFFVCLFIAGCR